MEGLSSAAGSFALRVPVAGDAVDWFELFDDPEIMRYISGGETRPLPWYVDFVARQQDLARRTGVCLFTVVVAGGRGTGERVAGFVGLQPWSRDWGPVGQLEIGWRLGAAFHGRGLATAAARQALSRGRDAGLPSPIAMIDLRNAPSIGVATKLGMTLLQQFDAPDGARVGMWGFALS